MRDNIYLDHAATTPVNEEVVETMTKALKENYENPSSIHQLGKKNRVLIEQARAKMGRSIGADAEEIVVTSGGTESDNMAIIKTAEKYQDRGKHIISTTIEHPAVLNPLKYLAEKGFEITYLSPDRNGEIKIEQVKEAIRPDTILLSIMYVNNEIGSIQPIKEIGELVQKVNPQIIFHTDAVQAYGVLTFDVNDLHVDLLSVSAHKMNGPKGIGFLYIREGLKIPSLLLGGAQENERRAGTENLPAILAFEKAIEINQENKEKNFEHLEALKSYFIKSLKNTKLNYSINGLIKKTTPHILSISFNDIPSELLLIQLDLNGLAVSAGSACSAGSLEDSHVLQSIYGETAEEIKHTIRCSFGSSNSFEEIDQVMKLLKKYA
ncbi:MAG: cysteine desulfurase [Atopostipes suicloacalis]|nr:cysteine desulfurase [Atopostipes suicloacalis]